MILAVVIHSAGVQDRDGAKLVLTKLQERFPALVAVWADGGYAGQLVDWVTSACGWVLTIVKRSDDVKGFVVLPKRWIVERTLAWLGKYRRLSKDYELLPETGVAFVHLAMIHIMVRRLASDPNSKQAGSWKGFRKREPLTQQTKPTGSGKKKAVRVPAAEKAPPTSKPPQPKEAHFGPGLHGFRRTLPII